MMPVYAEQFICVSLVNMILSNSSKLMIENVECIRFFCVTSNICNYVLVPPEVEYIQKMLGSGKPHTLVEILHSHFAFMALQLTAETYLLKG